MKSKSRKKKEKNPAVVVETVCNVPPPPPRRNVDVVKEALAERHPDAREVIMNGDAMFICNRFMQNDAARVGVARLIGLEPSKCNVCSHEAKEEQCNHCFFPLNNCRNGILEWLEMETGK